MHFHRRKQLRSDQLLLHIKQELGLSQKTHEIWICRTDVTRETGGHNMGCISTGAGTTNLEQGGWKRQIRETMF